MLTAGDIATFPEIVFDINVELDTRVMSVAEVLDLKPGSVVRMTRSAGENIDILVGGSVVGCGEIVIIEDAMGVRITDFNLEE
jgi:flagellar motor switch protein FliN